MLIGLLSVKNYEWFLSVILGSIGSSTQVLFTKIKNTCIYNFSFLSLFWQKIYHNWDEYYVMTFELSSYLFVLCFPKSKATAHSIIFYSNLLYNYFNIYLHIKKLNYVDIWTKFYHIISIFNSSVTYISEQNRSKGIVRRQWEVWKFEN